MPCTYVLIWVYNNKVRWCIHDMNVPASMLCNVTLSVPTYNCCVVLIIITFLFKIYPLYKHSYIHASTCILLFRFIIMVIDLDREIQKECMWVYCKIGLIIVGSRRPPSSYVTLSLHYVTSCNIFISTCTLSENKTN